MVSKSYSGEDHRFPPGSERVEEGPIYGSSSESRKRCSEKGKADVKSGSLGQGKRAHNKTDGDTDPTSSTLCANPAATGVSKLRTMHGNRDQPPTFDDTDTAKEKTYKPP